jgi:aquaporin Z
MNGLKGGPFREPTEDETPWIRDFHDDRYELRRLFAEFLGTFFLVLVTVGAIIVDAKSHGQIPLSAQVVAPGLAIVVIIYSVGSVSGAHVNPAVTFSYALRGNFPWRRVPGYWLAQFVGAVAAVEFLRLTLGDIAQLGESTPGAGVSGLTAFWFETVLTIGLVTVTLATASGQNNVGPNAAIARGAYIAAAGLWAAPITGASMNPMRSFAPALLGNHWSQLWIYLLGPFVGAVIAVAFAWVLRGAPTSEATRAAQGIGSAPTPESTPGDHT